MSRITRTGRDNTWSPHMSDWQRDRASAPMQRDPDHSLVGVIVAVLMSALLWGALIRWLVL